MATRPATLNPHLTVERVRLDTITPHPENPRNGDLEALADSLRTHGQYRPIVIQTSTRRILAGNHTAAAAQGLGWAELDAVLLDVDDTQARRILLADNRTADLARYDDGLLTRLLTDLADLDGGLLGTGYTDDDLTDLMASLARAEHAPLNGDERFSNTAAEDLANYQAKGVRFLMVEYPVERFARITDALARYRTEHGLDSNADAVAHLLGVPE